MDRFDLRVDVPPVRYQDLDLPADGESSAQIAARVAKARGRQQSRYADVPDVLVNADIEGKTLETHANPDADGKALLVQIADKFHLTARGYHRVMRVARTIADLAGADRVEYPHVAEAAVFACPPCHAGGGLRLFLLTSSTQGR